MFLLFHTPVSLLLFLGVLDFSPPPKGPCSLGLHPGPPSLLTLHILQEIGIPTCSLSYHLYGLAFVGSLRTSQVMGSYYRNLRESLGKPEAAFLLPGAGFRSRAPILGLGQLQNCLMPSTSAVVPGPASLLPGAQWSFHLCLFSCISSCSLVPCHHPL